MVIDKYTKKYLYHVLFCTLHTRGLESSEVIHLMSSNNYIFFSLVTLIFWFGTLILHNGIWKKNNIAYLKNRMWIQVVNIKN